MKILERYILQENFKPFILSLIVSTFVMLFDRILDLLNLIIDKRLDVVTIGSIFGLSLPFMLALTVPMSVLLASIMSFGRLSVDNEVVAFKSCGINIYSLLKPTIFAALLLSVFMIFFNNTVLPETNHKLKNMMIKANYRRPVTAIKPGIFTTMKQYTIYAKDRIDDELIGIIIYNREDAQFPSTITAKRGKIFLSNGGNSLKAVLYDGQMHERDKKNPERYTTRIFQSFTINLPDLGYQMNETGTDYRGDRELSSKAMMKIVKEKREEIQIAKNELQQTREKLAKVEEESKSLRNQRTEVSKHKNVISMTQDRITRAEKDIRSYMVEVHKKYAIAVACFIFVLIGAPVGIMTKTSGIGMAFSVSAFVFMIYYAILTGGEDLADRGLISPFLAMWISNIILGILGIYLVIISIKETRVIDLQKIIIGLLQRKKRANIR
jgi:lipopolysaccharide export system permease protein